MSNLAPRLIFFLSLMAISGNGVAAAVSSEAPAAILDQKPEAAPPVLKAPGKISVGVVSGETRTDFESKVLPFFKDQWSNCSACEVRNLSVYDEKGNWNVRALVSELEASLSSVTFLLFNVNWRFRAEEDKVLVDLLKKATANGVIVIGSAGYPKEGESSAPLKRTVLGQIPDVVIIGEINERERLLGSSYFGPEMLTAIKPPRDYVGKGLGPSFFAAKLAQNYSRKLPHDWIVQFRNQKMKSRKIWPQVEEFFSR